MLVLFLSLVFYRDYFVDLITPQTGQQFRAIFFTHPISLRLKLVAVDSEIKNFIYGGREHTMAH